MVLASRATTRPLGTIRLHMSSVRRAPSHSKLTKSSHKLFGVTLAIAVGMAPSHGAVAQENRVPADLIVTGGTIYTVDPDHPRAEAFVVRGGRIVFVGSASEAMVFRGPATRVVDAHGATVIPGMIDAHAHLIGLGQTLRRVDLRGVASYEEVIARVVARAKTAP